jgi:gas vesicle protein
VRVRSLVTLGTGAALGAGAMYLLDPEHGVERRREARRSALREARRGAVRAVTRAAQRTEEAALAAVAGYAEARNSPRTP